MILVKARPKFSHGHPQYRWIPLRQRVWGIARFLGEYTTGQSCPKSGAQNRIIRGLEHRVARFRGGNTGLISLLKNRGKKESFGDYRCAPISGILVYL